MDRQISEWRKRQKRLAYAKALATWTVTIALAGFVCLVIWILGVAILGH